MAEFYPSAPTSSPERTTTEEQWLHRRPPLTTVYTTTGQYLNFIYVLFENIVHFLENDDDVVQSEFSLYVRSGDLIEAIDDVTITLSYTGGDPIMNAKIFDLFNAYSVVSDIRVGRTLRRIVFE